MRYDQFNSDNLYHRHYRNHPSNIYNYTPPVVFAGPARFAGINVDMMMICARENHIKLTANEIENREFNLFPKLASIMDGRKDDIGLILVLNGINTPRDTFFSHVGFIANLAPKGVPVIGIYNPSEGVVSDSYRVFKEINDQKTPNVSLFINAFNEFFDLIEENNITTKMLVMPYSGSGATFCSAYNNMIREDQIRMEKHTILKGIATAKPMPMQLGPETQTLYSAKDGITGWGAKESKDYGIKILPPKSTGNLFTQWADEHKLQGPTYKGEIQNIFNKFNQEGRFHVGNSR